jgi:hypothetical protein
MPRPLVPAVEGLAVHAIELAHGAREIGVGRLQQQVVVIAHETVRMAEQTIAGDDLCQHDQEPLAVDIIGKERLAPIAPCGYMIEPARKLDTQRPRHPPTLALDPPEVQDVPREIHSPYHGCGILRPDPEGGGLWRST